MKPTFFSFTQRTTHLNGERPGTRHALPYNCEDNDCAGSYPADALQQALDKNTGGNLNTIFSQLYQTGFESPHYDKPTDTYSQDNKTFYPVTKTNSGNQFISGFDYSESENDKSDQYIIVIGNEDDQEKNILNTFDKHYGVPEKNIIHVANPTPVAMEAAYKKVATQSKGSTPKVLVYVGSEGNYFNEKDAANDFRLWEHDLDHKQTDDQRLDDGTTEAQLKAIHNKYLKDAEVCYLSTSCNSERMFFT